MKITSIVLLFLIANFFISCVGNKSNKTKENSTKLIGADRNAKGCIASAGYSYSIVKDQCIRVWEEGIRFEKNKLENGQETPVFVVLSADGLQAEIIWGGTDRPTILNKQNLNKGDAEPVLFDDKDDHVQIKFVKGGFWILLDKKPTYYNAGKEEKSKKLL